MWSCSQIPHFDRCPVNVTMPVNAFRISEACDLLSETKKPVTEIMFEVGFQTKSNFNREFRRSTEMTPLEWRRNRTNASAVREKVLFHDCVRSGLCFGSRRLTAPPYWRYEHHTRK
ncbi:helix-turn-helix transcriptional regulator [Agrobacterium vitis]|nr:helix-turn-helix transcriptional regulator [Allorhizobium ampelinum]